jgi:hypothetical protein
MAKHPKSIKKVNGIHEVSGSIPLGSTNKIKHLVGRLTRHLKELGHRIVGVDASPTPSPRSEAGVGSVYRSSCMCAHAVDEAGRGPSLR